VTVDHIKPKAHGGTDDDSNLAKPVLAVPSNKNGANASNDIILI
jgi:hypothetical protein